MSSLVKEKFALSIGGFDPSGGAGVLSDVKTMEVHRIHGLAVIAANTLQTDNYFEGIQPIPIADVRRQLELLLIRFPIDVVKIGLVPSLEFLTEILPLLVGKTIIWDPVLKASAGFQIHDSIPEEQLFEILKQIHLITPNIPEANRLFTDIGVSNLQRIARETNCNILLKGGHAEKTADDVLWTTTGLSHVFVGERFNNHQKHGTGCMLSAAIATNLAKGFALPDACAKAKSFVEWAMLSNPSLLADIVWAAEAVALNAITETKY